MNAYKLADELFNYLPSYDAEKFANMLRQQADRIALLENIVMDCDAILRKAQEK